MKILEIEKNNCYLNVNGKHVKILEISKDDILNALKIIYENDDVEIEEYDKEKIANEAEKIVYENLYKQFIKFKENKNKLKMEINEKFKDLEEKYNII